MRDSAVSSDPRIQRQLDRIDLHELLAEDLSLDPVLRVLDRLDNPQLRLPPVFHVSGTNGKGSTCAFLRTAIEASGLRAHVYTSPHLVRLNERIRVAGTLIDDSMLADLLEEVMDRAGDIGASFFEVTTAVAFLAFSRVPADACILEVGLGGILDATNVVPHPLVTGIAQLGIDHGRILGTSLEAIARHKAGIARAGVPLVTMRYAPAATEEIARIAAEVGAPLHVQGTDWDYHLDGDQLIYHDGHGAVETPQPAMAGAYQAENLALAVAMLRHQDRLPIAGDALARAALETRWPARMQRLGPGPLTALLPLGSELWLDGAHNAAAAPALRQFIEERFEGTPLDIVFGLLTTKQLDEMLVPFAGLPVTLRCVPVPGKEHHLPAAIAAAARARGIAASVESDVASALESVVRLAVPGRPPRVLILGSLYLAGDVLARNGELPD
jgi:dihydrofolate synthase/folylpolyglutamate synthase